MNIYMDGVPHDIDITSDADWLGALRHLENCSNLEPVGAFAAPSQEALSLHASTGLVFPTAAIEHLSAGVTRKVAAAEETAWRVTSPLLGLSGPLAALPYHYTEALMSARQRRNPAPAQFFDVFNHRAQSLLYRALRQNRFALDKERAVARGGEDRYSNMLAALCGYVTATRPKATNAAVPCDAVTSFAGLFTCRVRSARNLEQLLRHYFRLDIAIEQLAGRWVAIDNANRCRIGSRHGCNQQLGGAAVIGRRSWQVSAFFGVLVRHPNAEQLQKLAPGQPLRLALWSMVRAFVGADLDFHIDILTGNDVQHTARLGTAKVADCETIRLGWYGVLGTMSPAQNAVIRINNPTDARMHR